MEYNFQLIENVITRREIPEVIPLYEHFVDDPVIEQIMGYNFSEIDTTVEDGIVETWKKRIEFYRQMGYVYVPVELGVKFAPRATKMTKHDDISDTIKETGWTSVRSYSKHG